MIHYVPLFYNILLSLKYQIQIIMLHSFHLIYFVLLLPLTCCHSSSVTTLCSRYQNRSSLSSTSDLQYSKSLIQTVNSQINLDGYKILQLIANNKSIQAGQIVLDKLEGPILFGMQFGIGFIFAIVSWPFMLCCWLSNNCCCKVKYKAVPKTILITITIFTILTVATCIYGLFQTITLGDSIQKAGCSTAVITDDVLYGNVTQNGSLRFSGFYQINKQIVKLQDNLEFIAQNLSILMPNSSDPTINNVLQGLDTVKNSAIKLPNEDTNGTYLNLYYRTPLNSTSPTHTLPSFIPVFLGSSSASQGFVPIILALISNLSSTLTQMRQKSQNYINQISNINSEIDSIQSTSLQIVNNVQQVDRQMDDHLDIVMSLVTFSEVIVRVFYMVVVVFVVNVCLAAFLFGKKMKSCKQLFNYILKTFCVLLFITALIGFTISVSLTIALPPLTWSCQYLSSSLNSSSTFISTVFNYIDNFNFLVDQQILDDISVCMPFGNGKILDKIGINAVDGINNLTAVIDDIEQFDYKVFQGAILGQLDGGIEYIRQFTNGQILDFADNNSFNILEQLAKTGQKIYQNCTQQLLADSWVPTNNPNPQFPSIICDKPTQGNQSTCPSGIYPLTPQCQGCMDSTQLLNLYQKNAQTMNLIADLQARYGANCSFNTQLSNIWNNYYKVKNQAMGANVQGQPSKTGVLPRTMTLKANVDTLINTTDPALPQLIDNVKNGLNKISNIVDPKTGLLSGLNCKVMGQDFQRMQQSFCGSLYKDIYMTRIFFGVASHSILVTLFLVICVSKYRKIRQVPPLAIAHQQEHGQQHEHYHYSRIHEPRQYSINSHENQREQLNPYAQ